MIKKQSSQEKLLLELKIITAYLERLEIRMVNIEQRQAVLYDLFLKLENPTLKSIPVPPYSTYYNER